MELQAQVDVEEALSYCKPHTLALQRICCCPPMAKLEPMSLQNLILAAAAVAAADSLGCFIASSLALGQCPPLQTAGQVETKELCKMAAQATTELPSLRSCNAIPLALASVCLPN